MEDSKIRVGITQGDINGVGYEVILKTFADPVMLELCTPIIYGSPKVAAYHRKSLDLPTNFSIVNSASEAVFNRVTLLILMVCWLCIMTRDWHHSRPWLWMKE